MVSLLAYLAAVTMHLASLSGPNRLHDHASGLIAIGFSLPALSLGLLLVRLRPRSASGVALLVLAAAPTLTNGVETWGGTFGTAEPWPAAHLAAIVQPGVWVFNFAGFVLLCLTFPDGLLAGRRWRAMPWLFLGTALALNALISLDPSQYDSGGGVLPGEPPWSLPASVRTIVLAVAAIAFLAVLFCAVGSLGVRYRRGAELTRLQLRWLVLGAGSVPVLLGAGWIAEAQGASITVAYAGFGIAMQVVIPAAVTVAILRHDLFDVDRLLNASVSWLLTTLAAAAIFALTVLGVAELGSRGSQLGVTTAGFVAALTLLPVHRRLQAAVGWLFDRERTVMHSAMQAFVGRVRDGQAEPEDVEAVLRTCLDDPTLRVLLNRPSSAEYLDLAGAPSEVGPTERTIALRSGDSQVGVIILSRGAARQLRRARELAVEARLPIEVSRLRMHLRGALDDARSSRGRLVEVAAEERRRLERDLHDGAQQRILAVGMRLRSIQRWHPPDGPTYDELEAAVAALETTVAELRRLARGVRPSQLDDGLEAAIRALVSDSPIPVEVSVGDVHVTEAVATTAYFVVAEGLANTLKHAHAQSAKVIVSRRGERLAVDFSDDGRGGATSGSGLTTLRDRVDALHGRIEVISHPGVGTTIRAEF